MIFVTMIIDKVSKEGAASSKVYRGGTTFKIHRGLRGLVFNIHCRGVLFEMLTPGPSEVSYSTYIAGVSYSKC